MKRIAKIIRLIVFVFLFGISLLGVSPASAYTGVIGLYPPPTNCATPIVQKAFNVGNRVMSWHKPGWCTKGEVFEWHWFSSFRVYPYRKVTIPSDGYYCVYDYWASGIPEIGDWGVHLFRNGVYQTGNSSAFSVSFVLDNSSYFLKPLDGSPLGNRTPIIFIHGLDGEKSSLDFGWDNYIRELMTNPLWINFLKKYQIYFLRWDTGRCYSVASYALGTILDQDVNLRNKKVILAGHSMGVVMPRFPMNYYRVTQGIFKGQLFGERVIQHVSLAGPHNGTPGADRWWVDISANRLFKNDKSFAWITSWLYFSYIWNPSYQFLLYADMNNELFPGNITWNSAYLGTQTKRLESVGGAYDVRLLNSEDNYRSKVTAFGGNNTHLDMDAWQAVMLAYYFPFDQHKQLDLGSLLMANMPVPRSKNSSVWFDDSSPRFIANDGEVPLYSAFMLKAGYEDIFNVTSGGEVVWNASQLAKSTQAGKIILFNPADHKSFLDDRNIISSVLAEIARY